MDRTWYNLVIVLNVFNIFNVLVSSETYSVKIGEEHVNIVDKNFLSFTVDPMHLFSSVEAYNDKECTCMASFLTPAYLRIAGPSTSHMAFENASITIDNIDDYGTKEGSKPNFFKNLIRKRKRQTPQSIKISNRQWRKFVQWANKTGFDIVFALNNEERTSNGMWDPSSTLQVLNLAEKERIENIIWQLGYECNNQSIDEYLYDLETLRALTESAGDTLQWKTAGSDVTKCLHDSSDFRDYVTLAVDMSDVLLLNGNSSSQELERMSASDRVKLLTLIHHSATPLWITESPQWSTELERAADWMAGLGYSARNGFSVHFRELMAEELYVPSLSFYMALLYKNFVGDRVLPVDFDSSQAILFAHCTSLRHKPVPKAVTLYGVNMDNEPARLSLKLSKKEEGGEIMQFIMKQDENGDILVNGRVMSSKGDFRPVVKLVRPYKNLLINLPAKSFGFWVLANTNIKACQEFENHTVETVKKEVNKTENVNVEKKQRIKRSARNDDSDISLYDLEENNDIDNSIDTAALKEMIINFNNELKDAQNFFKLNVPHRFRRQVSDGLIPIRKLRRQQTKTRKDTKKDEDFENKPIISLVRSLLQLTRRNNTKLIRKPMRISKKRFGNKYFYDIMQNAEKTEERSKVSRSKRSIIGESDKNRMSRKTEDMTKENEIDIDDDEDKKLWHVLNKIQKQINKMSTDLSQNDYDSDAEEKSKENEKIVVKTEISDDGASINFNEIPGHGMVTTTLDKLFSVLSEVNRNLNRFWSVLSFLE